MLAGLEKPTKGSVVIAGQHIETLNEDQLVRFRRDHVGFIFQSFHLLGTMNAVENVALPLSFRGIPRDIRLKKADKMLDLVNLKKHKKHLPNQMSGGQQQRVGVARALVVDPKIIFADEPTGNLDSHTCLLYTSEKEGGEDKILNHMLLQQLLNYLDKDERQLIYLRYFANQTQTQVGRELGISQVQVSRMEKKILKNLRERI